MTVYIKDDKFGHCSRNCKLGIEDGSRFSEVVKRYEMHTKLPELLKGSEIAIQGELCGPGIQENYEKLEEHDFFVFDVFSITRQEYLSPQEREDILKYLAGKGLRFKTVPFIGNASLNQFTSIDDYLAFAEGPSLINPKREGVVFKRLDGKDSFKVISNQYLLKEK